MNVVVVTASNEEHRYKDVKDVINNKDGTLVVVSKEDKAQNGVWHTMGVYNVGSWKYWKLDVEQK